MEPILFVTTNPFKFQIAESACTAAGLLVEQVALEIEEIQSENSENIIRHKAKQAFE